MTPPRKRAPSRTAVSPLTPDDASAGWVASYGAWCLLAIAVALVVFVRLRLSAVPLERDEGEYAYAGQLILHGIPPYALAYNMKFPGTYYAYSLMLALFGQTPQGIHAGLLVVNLASTALVFFLGRRWLGSAAAALATAWFAVLSLDRGILGVFAHATHFVLLPALAGLLVLLKAIEAKRAAWFVWSGVLLGIAVLMKQQGVVFLALGLGWAMWTSLGRRTESGSRTATARLALVMAGAIAPAAILCLVLAAQGVLDRFWFWTVQYAAAYLDLIPADRAWQSAAERWHGVTGATLALWAPGAAGLAAVWRARWPAETRVFLSGLLLAGLAGASAGFFFRSHYWVLALPAVALLAGVAFASGERAIARLTRSPRIPRLAMLAASAAVLTGYVFTERAYCFSLEPEALSRATFGTNPFPEAVGIAQYIRERTAPGERVVVLGSEPEIYFYADRASATGYIYMYPLMEVQPFSRQMQQEMVSEIQDARPSYLVVASVPTSWINGVFSTQPILMWSYAYSKQCYDLVGVADIDRGGTTMVWGETAATYEPKSVNVVLTFKRKNGGDCRVPLSR